MGRTTDTTTFNRASYESLVREMRSRGERVADAGERIYSSTGKMDPLVDVTTGKRVSRNSMQKLSDGKFLLKNGIALPIVSFFDGTGSMGGDVAKAFEAIPALDTMLAGIRHRYNTQIASGVVQDVFDSHPVVQMSQFESDERVAKQLRLLIPDMNGADSTEDYDLALAYLNLGTETDIVRYGLKGYAFLVGDEIGRGRVGRDDVKTLLGCDLQANDNTVGKMSTQLLKSWHLFYIQVKGQPRTASWWKEAMGTGRVIQVDDSNLLAEVQAGLVYVCETRQPTEKGLTEFLLAGGGNTRISSADAKTVWKWLEVAKIHFGAQVKLTGYGDIPLPGSMFADYRDTWPMDHKEAGAEAALRPSLKVTNTGKKLDWKKF